MRSIGPLPAFSVSVHPAQTSLPLHAITREWAIGESTGKGVRVAIIDSGVDASHPDVGSVQGYVSVEPAGDDIELITSPHSDRAGHGTACASIVRSLAPDCELYSVRVLRAGGHGGFEATFRGIKWAVDNGMQVCNLSFGTTNPDFALRLHKIADRAYFGNSVLVVATNNMPAPSLPSTFASVISVAAHDEQNGELLYCNACPPAEFGAPGVGVTVARLGGGRLLVTGNSFAAPHVTGVVAKMLAKHPALHPGDVKAVLRAISANAVVAP